MRKTALYNECLSRGAKMINFVSWSLPLYFSSIIEEHQTVRNNIGLFDCSHMGQIFLFGKDAYKAVNFLISNNLDKIQQGKALYTGIFNEEGKFLDDLIVYFINSERFLFIVNAINIKKIFSFLKEKLREYHFDLSLDNASDRYSLLALQGKISPDFINTFFYRAYSQLNRFSFLNTFFLKQEILIARTGYTGEHGVEFLIPNDLAVPLFNFLVNKNIRPCGLGARDSLRIEKSYSLYGQEISEDINVFEAGLEWVCDFTKKDFLGKKALLELKKKGITRRFIAFKTRERPIARLGDQFLDSRGETIGVVTSGVFSPVLSQGIGMGLINSSFNSSSVQIKTKRKIISAFESQRDFLACQNEN